MTNHPNRSKKIRVGSSVIGGAGTSDEDRGIVHETRPGQAFVAWESGVSTWTPVEDLEIEA